MTHAKGSAGSQPEALRLPPQRTEKPLCISRTGSAPATTTKTATKRCQTKKAKSDPRGRRGGGVRSGSKAGKKKEAKNYSRMRKRMRNKNS